MPRRGGRAGVGIAEAEDGAVAVEFALIFSVLALTLFGVIEFGKVYSQYQVLQGAAREGGRMAAVRADSATVVARVYDAAQPYTPTNAPVVDKQCTADTSGEPVTVSWMQDFQISIPFWSDVNVTREIRGVFRCE